jgi:hypothetical protein
MGSKRFRTGGYSKAKSSKATGNKLGADDQVVKSLRQGTNTSSGTLGKKSASPGKTMGVKKGSTPQLKGQKQDPAIARGHSRMRRGKNRVPGGQQAMRG